MNQLEVAQASSRVSKVTLSCPEGKLTFHERSDGFFFLSHDWQNYGATTFVTKEENPD